MNAPAKCPTVTVELDALEADVDALNEAMVAIMDVMFVELNARGPLLVALEKVHEASYSMRRWIEFEAEGSEVTQ
jgi:hypothetical protein